MRRILWGIVLVLTVLGTAVAAEPETKLLSAADWAIIAELDKMATIAQERALRYQAESERAQALIRQRLGEMAVRYGAIGWTFDGNQKAFVKPQIQQGEPPKK